VVRVTAVYFEGATNCSHPIRDFSTEGALILTPTIWCPGTLIRLTLFYEGEHGAEFFVDLWCEVIRNTRDGICVKFRTLTKRERTRLFEFLEKIVHEQHPQTQNMLACLRRAGTG